MGTALGALGLSCALLAWSGLAETLGDFTAGALLVRVHTGAATAVPAAIMLLLPASMLIRRPSADERWEKLLFGLVLACVPMLVIMPVALSLGMGAALGDRQYRPCAGPMGSRQLFKRLWVRGDTPCPSPD